MLDADADPCRRAWLRCARCADSTGCPECAQRRHCEAHWRYLLAADGRHLFVQCPVCLHRWWHDTGFGRCDRPAALAALPEAPADGRAA